MKISCFLKIHLPVIYLLSCVSFGSFAQDVGIGTVAPLTTLDIRGNDNNGAVTGIDGLIPPRVNDLIVAGTQDGQMVYLIADSVNFKKGFYYWNGNNWSRFSQESNSSIIESLVEPDIFISGSPGPAVSFSVSAPLPRAIPSPGVVDIPIYVSGIVGTTTLVTILINITHPYDFDLEIILIAPTGQILELSNQNGSSGDNYILTNFTDSASESITSGSAPFTGDYRPEGLGVGTEAISTLGGFNGFNPNGTWYLRIHDYYTSDVGRLDSAILSISGSLPLMWVSVGEVGIKYLDGTAIIVQSTYSGDPQDMEGVVTALTRSSMSVGGGAVEANLPGAILSYASASPGGTGDRWINTFNQARDVDLDDDTVYYYQLWRKGNIETPVESNETFCLVPIRLDQ